MLRTLLIGSFMAAQAIAFAAIEAQAQGTGENGNGRFLDVLVRLDDSHAPGGAQANKAAAAEIARGLGLAPRLTYGTVTFGFAANVPEGQLTALRNDPRVQHVRLTRTVTIAADAAVNCARKPDHPRCGGGEDDPPAAQQTSWGYDRIGADFLLATGWGVHVFVLDTGIDSNHPDLLDNLTEPHRAVEEACSLGDCLQPWDDDHSHGTHVSGIIAAVDNSEGIIGVAPEVFLHAVKVLNSVASGSDAGIIDALDWIVDLIDTGVVPAPVVVNMSFATTNVFKTGTCDSTGYVPDGPDIDFYDQYHEAMCSAARAGVVLVAGAGNGGSDAESVVPAAYDDAVITVAATRVSTITTGRGRNRTVVEVDDWPSLSNWGDNVNSALPHDSAPVAIAAPGDNILSTINDGGTGTKSGTSMATPFVAGAAAAYLEGQSGALGYGWFQQVRMAIVDGAEETYCWTNSSGNPHAEEFLDANLNGVAC